MEKPRITKKQMAKVHPYIPEAYSLLEQNRISRREFMRMATLLGMSAGAATFAAACGAPAPTQAPAASGGGEAASGSEAAPSGGIKRGGTWTSAMQLQLLDHPARLSWVEGANIVRQLGEYLT
jgi:peptide/nickel transport system substrate-binding protein